MHTVTKHKDDLKVGDTILINGEAETLGRSDIRNDLFMGTLIKGVAYPFTYEVQLFPYYTDGKFQGYR
jgi:hypothetical protein